jgi:hypothetical protein
MLENAKVCPICGQPNNCRHDESLAAGNRCWCSDIKVSPRVLAMVPPEQLGKACICQDCIHKYQ